MFNENKQIMMDMVTKIIQARRADGNQQEVPFIDSMLQNYSSDDKVSQGELNVQGIHSLTLSSLLDLEQLLSLHLCATDCV